MSNDLFLKNMKESPLCHCGRIENAYQYFSECLLYTRHRFSLFTTVYVILNLLLSGEASLTDPQKELLCVCFTASLPPLRLFSPGTSMYIQSMYQHFSLFLKGFFFFFFFFFSFWEDYLFFFSFTFSHFQETSPNLLCLVLLNALITSHASHYLEKDDR